MAEVKLEGFAEEGAKAVYDRLKNDRQPYETRAESCAQYTIPRCSLRTPITHQPITRLRGNP